MMFIYLFFLVISVGLSFLEKEGHDGRARDTDLGFGSYVGLIRIRHAETLICLLIEFNMNQSRTIDA